MSIQLGVEILLLLINTWKIPLCKRQWKINDLVKIDLINQKYFVVEFGFNYNVDVD